MDEKTIEKYFELQEMVQYDLDDYGISAAHAYVTNLVKTRKPLPSPVSEHQNPKNVVLGDLIVNVSAYHRGEGPNTI